MAISPEQKENLEAKLKEVRLVPPPGCKDDTSFRQYNQWIESALFQAEEPRRDQAKYALKEAEKALKPLKKGNRDYYDLGMEGIKSIKDQYHL